MEENNTKQALKPTKNTHIMKILVLVVMFFLSGAVAGLGSLIYRREMNEMICYIIMVMLGTGIVIFALKASEVYQLYYY